MSSKSKSSIWKYFSKNDEFAICEICKSKMKFTGSTTSLWHHLKVKHAAQSGINARSAEKTSIGSSTDVESITIDELTDIESSDIHDSNLDVNPEFPKRKQLKLDHMLYSNVSKNKQELTTELITKMIAKDMLPLSFVEGKGFRELLQFIAPGYKIPSRQTISTRIELIYDVQKRKISEEISNLEAVSLTTDCWTSRANDSYITFTLHGICSQWTHKTYTLATDYLEERHTAINLWNKIEDILHLWNINEKVFAIVHDNAANIVSAIRDHGNIPNDVCCFAHTLQLVVNKALGIEDIKNLINKCCKIVSHFRHSTVASVALQGYQKNLNLDEHKLIQSVATRWNSTYYMISRLIEQRNAITSTLQDRSVTKSNVNIALELPETDWFLLESLEKILKPFEVVTTLISSETSPTISIATPIAKSLLNFLKETEYDTTIIKNFKQVLKDGVQKRFYLIPDKDNATNNLKLDIFDVSTFLDPRYKNKEREVDTKQKIKNKLDQIVEHEMADIPTDNFSKPGTSKSALELLFPEETNYNSQNEVSTYLLEIEIPKSEDPLKWWKNNEKRFPKLSKIAKRYLCTPATSTPAERVFSAAGNIVSAKRSCLSGRSVNMLVFLHNNLM